jgi:hypothetical protein
MRAGIARLLADEGVEVIAELSDATELLPAVQAGELVAAGHSNKHRHRRAPWRLIRAGSSPNSGSSRTPGPTAESSPCSPISELTHRRRSKRCAVGAGGGVTSPEVISWEGTRRRGGPVLRARKQWPGDVAQLARAPALQAGGRGFESHRLHHKSAGQRPFSGPYSVRSLGREST